MILGITHFGDKAFLPLLNEWLEVYANSGCKYNVVILADLTVPLPDNCVPYNTQDTARLSYLRFDPLLDIKIVRKKMAFDIKGALICQALKVLPRCIILDSDAFFVKDPSKLIEALPKVAMGIGEDPNTRYIAGLQEYIRERNAGVLYFGTNDSLDRDKVIALYKTSFISAKECNNNTMLEQIAWTLTSHILFNSKQCVELPKELNWSHQWGKNTNSTYILHMHGPSKYLTLKNAERGPSGEISPKYKDYYYA